MDQYLVCDIAVIGGGLGGLAAALAAAEAGMAVLPREPTDWIGGQVTAQAVSVLDEHRSIESFGGTRSYYRFREGVRAAYRARFGGPETMPDGMPLNPGNGWVSALCFEPRVGLQLLPDEQVSCSEAAWQLGCHPRARENGRFATLLEQWKTVPYAPFGSTDFHTALAALDQPALVSGYPTLREVCRKSHLNPLAPFS